MAGIHKLKDRTINSGKLKPGLHSDGGGLYLSVSKTGSKSWAYIWVKKNKTTNKNKRRQMGLGSLLSVTVADAREKAAKARRQVSQGLDPIKERDRIVSKSFGECATALIETLSGSWDHKKTGQQWKRSVDVYCLELKDLDIAAIDTSDVQKVLAPIWKEKPETARRVRSRIERIIDFATTKGWRKGDNPARWKNHLENILVSVDNSKHFAAMSYKEIPAFFTILQNTETTSARALEYTILNACRTGDTIGAVWNEIDFDAMTWTIPGERLKGKKNSNRAAHIVPLNERAMEVLHQQSKFKVSDFIFPGNKPNRGLSNMAMAKCLKGLVTEHATVHGFRSSFRDWAGDQTSFPREVAEAALAHRVGNSVELAYRRGQALEKRRDLMRLWCDYCTGSNSGNVVQIRG